MMLRTGILVCLSCMLGCAATVVDQADTTAAQRQKDLDTALLDDDVEAICRAAGASRCQRLNTQEESQSVEIYADADET